MPVLPEVAASPRGASSPRVLRPSAARVIRLALSGRALGELS